MAKKKGTTSISYRGVIAVSQGRYPTLFKLWDSLGEAQRGVSDIAQLLGEIEKALSERQKPSILDFFDAHPVRDARFLRAVGEGTEEDKRNRIIYLVSTGEQPGERQPPSGDMKKKRVKVDATKYMED